MRIGNNQFEVLSTTGDSHLGGQDFDNRLIDHLLKDFQSINGVDLSKNIKVIRRLKAQCEKAKHVLSQDGQANIEIECLYGEIDYCKTITRDRFEDLNKDLFEKSMDSVRLAVRDSNLSVKDIADVVLIGGSSRIPKLQKLLKDIFLGKNFINNINPDEAVAYGELYNIKYSIH